MKKMKGEQFRKQEARSLLEYKFLATSTYLVKWIRDPSNEDLH